MPMFIIAAITVLLFLLTALVISFKRLTNQHNIIIINWTEERLIMTYFTILLCLPLIILFLLFELYLWTWTFCNKPVSTVRFTSQVYRVIYQITTVIQIASLVCLAVDYYPLADLSLLASLENYKGCGGSVGQALQFTFQCLMTALSLWHTQKLIRVSLYINDYLLHTEPATAHIHAQQHPRSPYGHGYPTMITKFASSSSASAEESIVKRHRHPRLQAVFIVLIALLSIYTVFIWLIVGQRTCWPLWSSVPLEHFVHYAALVYLSVDIVAYSIAIHSLRLLLRPSVDCSRHEAPESQLSGADGHHEPKGSRSHLAPPPKDRLFTIEFEIDKYGYYSPQEANNANSDSERVRHKEGGSARTSHTMPLPYSLLSALPQRGAATDNDDPFERLGQLLHTQKYQLFITVLVILFSIIRYVIPVTTTGFSVLVTFYGILFNIGYAMRRTPLLIIYSRYPCPFTGGCSMPS
ncbi:hypothetical protein BDF19DRAFT_442617 [Syncephalis fuscata]|nr:hypothetical protein BDF19DRAFT_442617 [Syncephalis fuscata]